MGIDRLKTERIKEFKKLIKERDEIIKELKLSPLPKITYINKNINELDNLIQTLKEKVRDLNLQNSKRRNILRINKIEQQIKKIDSKYNISNIRLNSKKNETYIKNTLIEVAKKLYIINKFKRYNSNNSYNGIHTDLMEDLSNAQKIQFDTFISNNIGLEIILDKMNSCIDIKTQKKHSTPSPIIHTNPKYTSPSPIIHTKSKHTSPSPIIDNTLQTGRPMCNVLSNKSVYVPDKGCVECTDNDMCDPSEICNTQNICIDDLLGEYCNYDKDCGDPLVCNNNMCVEECMTQSDCNDKSSICCIDNDSAGAGACFANTCPANSRDIMDT